MPNRWTGGFDAAIELAPAGANSLLAAIHRKGHAMPDEPHAGPHLLHRLALNLPLPASAATHGLRGHLQIQLSTPSVSIPAGPAGRATVSIEIYAWFQKNFGSAPAPEFLHGTLRFTTGIAIVECAGSTLAEIRVGSNTVEVSFTPAPGTTLGAEQRALVEAAARDALQKGLGPVQFRVASLGSGDFAVGHVAFRTQRSGASSAFELLISFDDGSGPVPQPGPESEIFLTAGDDLALALGREFLTAKLLEAAREKLSGIEVSGSRFGVSFQAAPDPNTLSITLHPGILRATIDGSGSLSPGGSFAFRLRQDFGLTTNAGNLFLTLAGEPGLSLTQGNTFLQIVFGVFKGLILDKLEVAASGVIQVANAELNELVDRSIEDLATEVGAPGLSLRMQRAAIDADAVVLGGAIHLGAAPPVVAQFTNVIEGPAATNLFAAVKFDALESWIPGGTIDGYTWVQVQLGGPIETLVDEPHRFVLRLEPTITTATAAQHYGWPPYFWCLEVRGTQFIGALDPVRVTGGVCGLTVVVPSVDISAGLDHLTIQVPDGEGGVLADLNPWSRYRSHAFAGDAENRGHLLVHRSGKAVREAVAIVREALSGPLRTASIFPTLVVEPGACSGISPRELAGIALTEDPQGAWRRRFDLERDGSTVLVGPGGKELWRDGGPLRLESLLKALKALDLDGARPPRQTPVQLGLKLGVIAPDLFFQCTPPVATDHFAMSMRKLRGQELELCFWTTWSDASLEELRRRAEDAKGRRGGPRQILVNDGEDPARAAEFLKQHGLAFEHTATDPDRGLSRRFGISCWPTVVRIDAEGRVAAARFGLEHAHAGRPARSH